ncbi:hypothetical protein RFI_21884, partial [Reticulomyxa filosa]
MFGSPKKRPQSLMDSSTSENQKEDEFEFGFSDSELEDGDDEKELPPNALKGDVIGFVNVNLFDKEGRLKISPADSGASFALFNEKNRPCAQKKSQHVVAPSTVIESTKSKNDKAASSVVRRNTAAGVEELKKYRRVAVQTPKTYDISYEKKALDHNKKQNKNNDNDDNENNENNNKALESLPLNTAEIVQISSEDKEES